MIARSLLVCFAVWLASGCSTVSVLDPAGPVAHGNRASLMSALVIMLAIVVPTMIAIVAFAWWFRAGNARATYRPEFVFSGRIELVVWSIPLLVILFLAGVIWIGSHRLDPAAPLAPQAETVEVQVVALDWKWLFIYPDQGIATVNHVVIPAGRAVRFRLTSASVMNAFFVPRLGSMIYAMNGMETDLHLRADRAGRYYGQSSHYSGDGFADMHFTVDAVPPVAFASWAAQARGTGGRLDAATYRDLARQGTAPQVLAFGSVAPGLFADIVTQRIPPADGPRQAEGGRQVPG
ncbi:ubiquinol oxidase subunit II [Erythrobacter sp. NE805]|uniref:ubiquinol oxidase subunit II n=1 Tax=Erythrobacter sp. NE805 TaxID=3389875 RepID=UPI00396B0C27